MHDHKAELEKLGLTKRLPKLGELAKGRQPPPGQPKKVGQTDVYPKLPPHFGQPTGA